MRQIADRAFCIYPFALRLWALDLTYSETVLRLPITAKRIVSQIA